MILPSTIRKQYGIWVALLIVFVADRVSKIFVMREVEQPTTIVRNLVNIVAVKNQEFALSIHGSPWLIMILSGILVFVFLALTVYWIVHKHPLYVFGFGAISVGAIANFFDRIQYGGVIDWISFSFFPTVINIADIIITIGVSTLLISVFVNRNAYARPSFNSSDRRD